MHSSPATLVAVGVGKNVAMPIITTLAAIWVKKMATTIGIAIARTRLGKNVGMQIMILRIQILKVLKVQKVQKSL